MNKILVGALLVWMSISVQGAETSEKDIVDGILASDSFVDGLAGFDVQSMYAALDERIQEGLSPDAMARSFTTVRGALGDLSYAVLASVGINDQGCQERWYAGVFERGKGRLRTVVCKSGDAWKVTAYDISPDLASMSKYLLEHVFAPRFEVHFMSLHCDLDPEPAIGERYQCETTTSAGESVMWTLIRTGESDVEGDQYVKIGEVPEPPSDQLLVTHMQRLISQISLQRVREIHTESALNLRAGTSIEDVVNVVEPLYEALGPITKAELDHVGKHQPTGLPRVWMNVTFAEGAKGTITGSFIPDRGEWKIFAFNFYPIEGSPAQRQMLNVVLQQLAWAATGDPEASVSCDTEALIALTGVVCPGIAYGREIRLIAQPFAGTPEEPVISIYLSTTDIQSNLRAMLAGLAPQLGWQVEQMSCSPEQPEDGELSICQIRSSDGHRELTVLQTDGRLRVVHLRPRSVGS